MKFYLPAVLLVLLAFACNITIAQTTNNEECKRFSVAFNEAVKVVPSGVYAGKQRIGTVQLADTGTTGFQGLFVCIDKKHSGVMGKNTICYLSGDKLIVYSVWVPGVDLREGDTLKGFPDRSSVYIYEVKVLFQAGVDYAVSFARDRLGNLLGEKTEMTRSI